MDNNSLVADISTWERGKDYPDFFDDVSLSTISTRVKKEIKRIYC